MVPQVDGSDVKVLPMMTTADMSLKVDPKYKLICERFWRTLRSLVKRLLVPGLNYYIVIWDQKAIMSVAIIKTLNTFGKILHLQVSYLTSKEEDVIRKTLSDSDLSIQEMVNTALSSAITFRGSDNRGGANGSRIRLEPQKNWDVNKPHELEKVLNVYEKIADKYKTSIADVIVIGGAVGIEKACGHKVNVTTGRGDATQENTDIESFNLLKPKACGLRNYSEKEFSVSPEEIFLDKAQLLGLTPAEMTVLTGGLRAMGISFTGEGIWTDGKLNNTWFKILLSMDVEWSPDRLQQL